ncbi:MAG: hypothetical protein HF982_14970 [Desulfobacteraceae bacterium]|nr:hypothetical protein [Desulfobacteraceae bacterium]MBC2720858.1 hypothetical protein [Desulfobacteraceae bacterium]
MKQKFYVLLGDVIQSRQIDNRDDFQKKIEETCKNINTMYAEGIYADFKILKGIDEIGGVLSSMSNIYKIITRILNDIYPNTIRFALVFDYIDTALETRNVTKMDGVAFHKASEMIRELKMSKLMFNMSVEDEMLDMSITGQINLIFLIKKNRSATQYNIVREYEKTKKQSEVAKKLRITQQAVSKNLKRSMWKEIRTFEEKINFILQDYPQQVNANDDDLLI